MSHMKVYSQCNYVKNVGIAQTLALEKRITFKVSGKSMLPMLIPNRDLITIKFLEDDELLSINDIVLYYNHRNKLTLHRIVNINNGLYCLLGDNCSKKEFDIKKSDIIGKLVCFKHRGIHYELNDIKYLNYVSYIRKNELKRMKSKFIYEIIVQVLSKLIPVKLLDQHKHILKRIIIWGQRDLK